MEEVEEEIEKLNCSTDMDLNEQEISYTTKDEILTIVKGFKNKKAPGEDGIQGIVLKNLPNNIIEVIVDILNSSIKARYFPNHWKNAIIIPIENPATDQSASFQFCQNYTK